MIKISGVVITKNSENDIADCLESLSFCDEVIVVDNKSVDRTRDVAEKLGAKVFSYSSESFSDIRNYGLKKAQGEWLLYVDSDERVTKELGKNIKLAIDNNENYSAYKILRKNFYFGNHEWPYIEHLERLFKKKDLEGWYGELHESPKINGKVGRIDGYLLHYTHKELSSMLSKTIEWSKIEASLRYNSGHPRMSWWRFPRVMTTAFFDSYIGQSGWRAGTAGLIESLYQAFSMFVTYARLWELQNKLKN